MADEMAASMSFRLFDVSGALLTNFLRNITQIDVLNMFSSGKSLVD